MMEKSMDSLSDVQKLQKEFMRNGVLKSTKDMILNKCYIPLSVNTRYGGCTISDLIARVFGEGPEPGKLLLSGGPGMGKTTAVEQLIWDWSLESGVQFQRFTFILRLSLSVFHGPKQSLQSMLLSSHPHISADHLEIIFRTPHTILLVLDNVHNFLTNATGSAELVSDPHQPVGGSVLVHSLIEGSLLPGVSLLLTSRGASEMNHVNVAELTGFSNSQKKAFFQRFFDSDDKGEQILRRCEQAVEIKELCVCPGFCWTLCCVCKEQLESRNCIPNTLSELYCVIVHTLLREHNVSVETAKELIYGLGKLADLCTSLACTPSDIITCGLQPFLGSQILSAILRNATSSDATFSFMSQTFKDFVRVASFYLDYDDDGDASRILESPMKINNYHFFLAGLSDPMQRKLLESSVGLLSSSRISEFHHWIMSTAAEVLPSMRNTEHWHVLRILYHTLSPTLVRESIGKSNWRLMSYAGMQEADCEAMAFVVRCIGQLEDLNLYMSSLSEGQAQRLMTVFRMAQGICLSQSKLSMAVIRLLAQALKDGRATGINLTHCKLGEEAVKILCLSLKHSRIHTLNLWDCHVTAACSEVLGEMLSMSKLCVLDLGANDLNDEGLIRLIGALGTSACSLQTLGLDHCPLTGLGLAVLSSALMSSLSNLNNLNLSRNSLCGDTLEHLSEALQSGRCSLTILRLYSNQLTGSCCPSLAAALQSEHCPLSRLDLSVNEFDESGALLICEALKSPKCSLESFEMNACTLTAAVFSALGSVLMCGTNRLKELNIGVNRVGDAAVRPILEALKHPHCQIQHLDFEMLNLTDACLDELCESIMACESLKSLILSNNVFTDSAVPRFVKLVEDRPVLKLNLQYNDFSEDVFELMDDYETIRY